MCFARYADNPSRDGTLEVSKVSASRRIETWIFRKSGSKDGGQGFRVWEGRSRRGGSCSPTQCSRVVGLTNHVAVKHIAAFLRRFVRGARVFRLGGIHVC